MFQIYLDMDGVLSNFDEAISCPNTYENLAKTRQEIADLLPELTGFNQHAMKKWFGDNIHRRKTDPNVLDAHRLFKKYTHQFYYHVEQPGFFELLPLFPGARDLVDGVIEIGKGQRPIVLTAPVQTPWCPVEKHTWIEVHFPGKFSNFICQKDKAAYAAPNSVLVDDMTKNTIPWMEQGGGLAVLYTGDVSSTFEKIQKFADLFTRS